MKKTITKVEIGGRKPDYSGKVREIFDLGDELIIVATDRLSAFDVVFTDGIPEKGIILTEISNVWFSMLDFVENHIIETDIKKFPAPFNSQENFKGRSVYVKKADRIDMECITRGYLAGSGYKDYTNTGMISGTKLPKGLKLAQRLPEPIFTPSTKAEVGHDENITKDEARDMIGMDLFSKIEELSLSIYSFAHDKMEREGIILADTKFEFGLINGEIILIDEALTPDSSRYWPMDSYRVGESPPSFDKQFVRDFLETTDWDKTPPAPKLPDDIVLGTRDKYRKILEVIRKINSDI
ncbi:MAG: phosphoribosylaminoimidazolesuccinocarboxamide synthase [Deltaproteobacteria bacterium]|uniref:Phosphoribosylaminoimidazole-succinocarboxamide synthase n=1 Tax=Candidatus Zymogenus saltonus TaxID=2844893 RepID=A0A9D8KDA1_9DELT|nr:phosphoribosylaminoimidazolesuccinocarboxamide synthase [Candidatus Zymogenus saltonus]